MNNVCQVAITAITLNGSVTLPFVIPSEAEGSAGPQTIPGNVDGGVIEHYLSYEYLP
jgi:hypothetical protein